MFSLSKTQRAVLSGLTNNLMRKIIFPMWKDRIVLWEVHKYILRKYYLLLNSITQTKNIKAMLP
jgi:hypothetical protein